ncbi:MAG: hypothetical protein ACR2QE_13630 [Acidimicrobiales bacterium]
MPRDLVEPVARPARLFTTLSLVVAMIAATLVVVVGGVAGADPSIVVNPNSNVADGTTVVVRGAGFPPGTTAATAQCASVVLQTNDVLGDCDTDNFRTGAVQPNGRVRLELTAYRFLDLGNEVIDCAVPGSCIIGIGSSENFPEVGEFATTEIDFDDTVVNDPPLEVEANLLGWTSRSIDVEVTCSRPASGNVRATIAQDGPDNFTNPFVSGSRYVECDGVTRVSFPLVPRQNQGRGGLIYPFRRLKSGPASLTVNATMQSERWYQTTNIIEEIELVDPGLHRRITDDNSTATTVRLRGIRVTRSGRGVAKVELSCAADVGSPYVWVSLLADGPGATYRTANGAWSQPCEAGHHVISVPVDSLERAHRANVIPAGDIEAMAAVDDLEGGYSLDMRPLTTNRDILPPSLRVSHNPASRLRIGHATGSVRSHQLNRVRASFRCGRTAPFTVFATIGQPIGATVHQRFERVDVQCVAGRTVVFDVPWSPGIQSGRRTAITLQAVNGHHYHWTGPFQQTQGAWRTTR